MNIVPVIVGIVAFVVATVLTWRFLSIASLPPRLRVVKTDSKPDLGDAA